MISMVSPKNLIPISWHEGKRNRTSIYQTNVIKFHYTSNTENSRNVYLVSTVDTHYNDVGRRIERPLEMAAFLVLLTIVN